MCHAKLIIICETVGCLYQQRDVCQITWPPCCALCTVHSFIKHHECVQSAYLWNNPYIYQSNIPEDLVLYSQVNWHNFKFLETQLTLWLAHFYKLKQHLIQQELFVMKTRFVLVLTCFCPVPPTTPSPKD